LAPIIELGEQSPASALLAEKLMQFNESHARPYDFAALRLGIFDTHGNIEAGLLGATGWRWLNIDVVFVEAARRNAGLGRALVERAMIIARSRGCIGAMLDTFDFQARGFYEKQGFQVFGELADMPPGHRRYWLRRTL
jgi:GNAT superfamily N-acetyltransferase